MSKAQNTGAEVQLKLQSARPIKTTVFRESRKESSSSILPPLVNLNNLANDIDKKNDLQINRISKILCSHLS